MHIGLTRTPRGTRSILPRVRVNLAVQPERAGKLILGVERKAAIADYLPRRLAALLLAGPVTV